MKRLGEVVTSATTHWVAQALREPGSGLTMPKAPPFGAFVRADLEEADTSVYGLVYHVETTSIDAAHRPIALNMSRQELREQQPQIFDLLRTDFAVLVVGFRDCETVRPYLPPCPPQVHDFVYAAGPDEVIALTQRFDFLRLVLAFAQAPADDLAAACLRHAEAARGGDPAFMLAAGRELSTLLRHDYARLTGILSRLTGSPAAARPAESAPPDR